MLKKTFYLGIPILFGLILLFVFYQPSLIKIIIGDSLILVLTFLTGIFLIQGKIKKQWIFLVQLILFVLSGLGFFLFLSGFFWITIFLFLFLIILGFFLFHLFQFFYQPRICQPDIFQKTVLWLNFIISYWAMAFLSGVLAKSAFELSFFINLLAVFGLFFWLNYYYLFFNRLDEFKNDLLIVSLFLTEIYLGLNFLPLGIYINAFLISLILLAIYFFYFSQNKKIEL